jgi:hypothetical protein
MDYQLKEIKAPGKAELQNSADILTQTGLQVKIS